MQATRSEADAQGTLWVAVIAVLPPGRAVRRLQQVADPHVFAKRVLRGDAGIVRQGEEIGTMRLDKTRMEARRGAEVVLGASGVAELVQHPSQVEVSGRVPRLQRRRAPENPGGLFAPALSRQDAAEVQVQVCHAWRQ